MKTYPESPSGMTGVQTTLPLMLNHVSQGRLSLQRLVELLSSKPAQIFKIPNKGAIREGYDADLTLVDLKSSRRIENSMIHSKCRWTPFDGFTVTGWPIITIIGGEISMQEGELIGNPCGKPLFAF